MHVRWLVPRNGQGRSGRGVNRRVRSSKQGAMQACRHACVAPMQRRPGSRRNLPHPGAAHRPPRPAPKAGTEGLRGDMRWPGSGPSAAPQGPLPPPPRPPVGSPISSRFRSSEGSAVSSSSVSALASSSPQPARPGDSSPVGSGAGGSPAVSAAASGNSLRRAGQGRAGLDAYRSGSKGAACPCVHGPGPGLAAAVNAWPAEMSGQARNDIMKRVRANRRALCCGGRLTKRRSEPGRRCTGRPPAERAPRQWAAASVRCRGRGPGGAAAVG